VQGGTKREKEGKGGRRREKEGEGEKEGREGGRRDAPASRRISSTEATISIESVEAFTA
jgi:hypothetical protein